MYNTVSLEVGKELFNLGWRKVCLFSSLQGREAHCNTMDSPEILDDCICEDYFYMPQLHEILEVLPAYIKVGKILNADFYYLTIEKDHRYYMISYDNLEEKSLGESEWNENPHEAAAKLLIWCVQNNYITL